MVCEENAGASRLASAAVALPSVGVVILALLLPAGVLATGRQAQPGWVRTSILGPCFVGGMGFLWLAVGEDWREVEKTGNCNMDLLRVSLMASPRARGTVPSRSCRAAVVGQGLTFEF